MAIPRVWSVVVSGKMKREQRRAAPLFRVHNSHTFISFRDIIHFIARLLIINDTGSHTWQALIPAQGRAQDQYVLNQIA